MVFQRNSGKVNEWWIKKKNSRLSKLAILFINNAIKEYGEVVDLNIDSREKNIYLIVLLKGEEQGIKAVIERYEVIYGGNNTFIRFNGITVSRIWIQSMIENIIIPDYAPGNRIEINKFYARIVDLLI